jgi:hypothetical protein
MAVHKPSLIAASLFVITLIYTISHIDFSLFSSSSPITSAQIETSDTSADEILVTPDTSNLELLPIEVKLSKNSSIVKGFLDECIDIPSYDNMEEQFNKQHDSYLNFLEKNNNSDNKLAMFMQDHLSNENFNFEALLAIDVSPLNEKLRYEHLLLQCNQNFDAKYCHDNLYSQAVNIDKDNAYLWHLIATIHLSQGKIEKALSMIRKANNKANFNGYYFEKISFLEQNYQANTSLNFNVRLISAIRFSSTRWSPTYTPISNFCRDNQSEINIADLCLQTAIQLEKSSKTTFSSLIGLAMQETHYKHSYQIDLLQELEHKRKKYKEQFNKDSDVVALSSLMLMDEKLSQVWLSSGLLKGEGFAYNQAMNELLILSKNKNYSPCKQYNFDMK